jgi:hypothetical protein
MNYSPAKYIVIFIMCFISLSAQNNQTKLSSINGKSLSDSLKYVWIQNETADIFPEPVDVKYSDDYLELFDDAGNSKGFVIAKTNQEKKAANVFNRQLSKFKLPELCTVESLAEAPENVNVIIKLNSGERKLNENGEQAYSIKWNTVQHNVVEVSASAEKGLVYGITSLAQLVVKRNNKVFLRKAEVEDFPKFSERIFSVSNRPIPINIEDELDWMVRYKIECIALHNKDYSWDKIDDELKANLKQYSGWTKNYGGVEALLMLNLYKGSPIEVSDRNNIEKLINIIDTAYQYGVSRFMILADDSPPFRYGEGYVSNSKSDNEKFSSMAESHCYLMKEIIDWNKKKKHNLEFMYCPAFYTNQDTYYGDMTMYKNTQWENDAYNPLKRDLKIIGENMPGEVQIMWTGPEVCSRTITDEDLNNWVNNLQERKPFLFDNTAFVQYEFTSRTMFTAYENNFPKDFNLKTGGNGLFINGDGSIGDGTGETSRAVTMTANAYMWEGDKYKPQVSLINAMTKLYGKKAVNTLMMYKNTELELVKIIMQKELLSASEEIQKSIQEIKSIIGLDPLKYQQNLSRMKALQMQLEYSVPPVGSFEDFRNKCEELDKKRKMLLKEIENLSFKRLGYLLKQEMIQLPDFSTGK